MSISLVGFPLSHYRIRLENIRFRANHGALAPERQLLQDFLVTVEMHLPATHLVQSNNQLEVFDYSSIADMVVKEGTKQTYHFLEAVAQSVINRIFRDTPAIQVRVAVTKLQPPTKHSVDAVTVELIADQSLTNP
ncbi:dihydroneopterin aldolase [Pajaroellobacter abortibovis]|uniref:dihydroneopterin aldolase n=1 Tax=Pajaroellobacter abortibovis TaxID=1882918 RepID=A0A1L6MWY6_9BACT|nr:dihydroneopterin aldolase [Pajaroellobacter abortibovis]APR99927.1 hypothetical protein BCY86_03960 [Pajaroellobacter abortibovis]